MPRLARHCAIVSLGLLILVSRFWHGLLPPQLWAEEGWTFYPQAYAQGFASLSIPVGGYLNTAQRLGALFTVYLGLPLSLVPTCFVLMALAAQLAVALFIVGPRLVPLWPDWRARGAFAFVYLALPNSVETFGNLTNVQWHLSLLAFMVVLSPARRSIGWRSFDAAALLLSGLSGPFCILLVPICAYRLWANWHGDTKLPEGSWRTLLVAGCAIVQLATLLLHPSSRHLAPLAAGPRSLTRIVSLQVVLGLLLGLNTISSIFNTTFWHANLPAEIITAVAGVLALFVLVRGEFLTRAALLFGAEVFASELANPAVSATTPQWQVLMVPWAGQRYFLIPMLAWAVVLFRLAGDRAWLMRGVGLAGLAIMFLWAIPRDWLYPDLGPTNFYEQARVFAAAPAGTQVAFSIHPPGSTMVLTKRIR